MYCERCKRDLKESAPRSRKMRDEREDAKYSRANETMNTSTTSQHSKSMDMEIDY